jgi:trans-aconitate methyltransferase
VAVEPVRAGSRWLALREPADAEARSTDLVEVLLPRLPAAGVTVVHDLGSGTGSMMRWLAPRLPGAQHWVLHDRDAELLGLVTAPSLPVTVETRCDDIARPDAEQLSGGSLVTASALLDMMTEDELARLVDRCTGAGCPVLVALSVTGEVELTPADPLDDVLRRAFNAHQRRDRGDGRLLGPDAAATAVERFRGHGLEVRSAATPWRLGPSHVELAREWFRGWVAAACEQEPGLRPTAAPYVERRLTELDAGRLSVSVGHLDLLALPPTP